MFANETQWLRQAQSPLKIANIELHSDLNKK